VTEGLQNQLRFLEIADKMKSVFRQSMLIDGSRYENDAEHSWHLALMAMTLFEHCALENVNIDRVIRMPEKRRELAVQYINDDMIRCYMAYHDGKVVGWCNANEKTECLHCIRRI